MSPANWSSSALKEHCWDQSHRSACSGQLYDFVHMKANLQRVDKAVRKFDDSLAEEVEKKKYDQTELKLEAYKK